MERAVTDKSLPTYYPELLRRFNAFDSTLTTFDCRLLYYGFVFQPAYSPYGDNKVRAIRDHLKAQDYRAAQLTCDSVLHEWPVSLEAFHDCTVLSGSLFQRRAHRAQVFYRLARFARAAQTLA